VNPPFTPSPHAAGSTPGSADAPTVRRPVIAVVVAGGGLKPFSALPLFEFLDSAGIREDLLVGCSGGGLVAALRAGGHSCAEIRGLINRLLDRRLFKKDWRSLLGGYRLPGGRLGKPFGMLDPKPYRALCGRLFGDRQLEDLRPRTILHVTDFDTGEGIGLDRGRLADIVAATTALYPLFPPVQIGSRWFFDGLYSAPVPIMHAVKHSADIIIALEFMERLQANPRSFFDGLTHVNKIFTQTIMRHQLTLSVMWHHYEIIYVKVRFEDYIHIWDVEAVPRILAAGERAVAEYRPAILDAIRGFHPAA